MFRLSVVDHIRLNFDRTSQNYTVHAKAAERLAALTAWVRMGVLVLLASPPEAGMASLSIPPPALLDHHGDRRRDRVRRAAFTWRPASRSG